MDQGWVQDRAHALSNLDKAREVFAATVKHRPRIRLTIRQRTHVIEQWPKAATYLRPQAALAR
jgi:hypothetical protein